VYAAKILLFRVKIQLTDDARIKLLCFRVSSKASDKIIVTKTSQMLHYVPKKSKASACAETLLTPYEKYTHHKCTSFSEKTNI
jgi:hypothetical protein